MKAPRVGSLAQSILSSADSLQTWTAVKKTFQMSSYTVWAHSPVDFDSLQPYKCTVHRAKCLSNSQLPYPKLGTNYCVSNWEALYLHVCVCKCIRIINMNDHGFTTWQYLLWKVADSIILSQTISHSDHKYCLWCIKWLIGNYPKGTPSILYLVNCEYSN